MASTEFAEKILDSMVDENGNCGERGLSAKQFYILSEHLADGEWEYVTSWIGDYGRKDFYEKGYVGNIGKYYVELNWYAHFNDRYTVKSIELRDADEYQAEIDAEAKLKAMRDFSKSEWIGEVKKRLDLTLTLVNDYEYYGRSYSYYDKGERHIYTFRDERGNCIVWKTSNPLGIWVDGKWVEADIESIVTMRATVKEHGEYKGIKQTVVTRCNVTSID